MSKPYRPANGEEGLRFQANFCNRCKHDNHRLPRKPPCPILGRTIVYDIDDILYPVEWIQDEDGARCTAFEEK